MPFGSQTKTYTLAGAGEDTEWRMGSGDRARAVRPIVVPTAPEPEWWSAYLLEAWQRRVGVQPRRDERTGLQRAEDKWRDECRRNVWEDRFRPASTGGPPHDVWGAR